MQKKQYANKVDYKKVHILCTTEFLLHKIAIIIILRTPAPKADAIPLNTNSYLVITEVAINWEYKVE